MIRIIKHKLQADNRGDTIIEVLIAIAIVSLILAGAYSISGRSLNTVRDSQEHSQAMQIAQGQLDILNSHGGLDLLTQQCFDASGNRQSIATGNCSFDKNNNINCTTSASAYCYRVTITQPALPNQTTYRVTVTWDRIGGGNNSVSMDYRLGPSIAASGITDLGGDCIAHPWNPWCNAPPCPTCVWTPPCPIGSASNATCYHWDGTFYNASPIAQDPLVIGCTWNWGDGTPDSVDVSCKSGDRITHTFATNSTLINTCCWATGDDFMSAMPYPNGCWYLYQAYTVTLTVRLSNGLEPVKPFDKFHLPWC